MVVKASGALFNSAMGCIAELYEGSLANAGVVGVIQYHHSVNGPGGAKKEATSGAAVQPAPGSEYELVAAVSGIRAQVYGEDFQDFMHHGATQRSSVHAYMDLFCYQAPASRCSEKNQSLMSI